MTTNENYTLQSLYLQQEWCMVRSLSDFPRKSLLWCCGLKPPQRHNNELTQFHHNRNLFQFRQRGVNFKSVSHILYFLPRISTNPWAIMSYKLPPWESIPSSSLSQMVLYIRDKRKTCCYCLFINKFLSFNYSGICTG